MAPWSGTAGPGEVHMCAPVSALSAIIVAVFAPDSAHTTPSPAVNWLMAAVSGKYVAHLRSPVKASMAKR